MACVFLLGPKTVYGQSEQNPAFWLQLLLFAKNRTECTWNDPNKEKMGSRILQPSDFRLWIRFLMSFMINGIGFHILVHALPIQVAAQSSLTGVVFRAVGMMYLVDLDDTPGYRLTLVEKKDTEADKPEPGEAAEPAALTEGATAVLAQQIIDDARAQLDALAAGQDYGDYGKKMRMNGALAFAAGVRDQDEAEGDMEGGDGGGEEDGGGDGGGEDE
jgi:hypothetical protein